MMNNSRKSGSTFKGYPLLDFVQAGGFNLDKVLRSSALKTELERHIRAFGTGEGTNDCGTPHSRRGNRPAVVNPYVGAMATDGRTAQSFEQRLEKFFSGLYLGCFQSRAIQAGGRRPPQRYIYDIGFNTDKPTGFIVANPFDTLLTFAPRGRHVPYGVFDPTIVKTPSALNVKVSSPTPTGKASSKRANIRNPDFNPAFGTAAVTGAGADEGRAAILCDLNIRVVTNHNQELEQLSFYGDTLQVHLSKGLVAPVERSATQWIETGKRLAIPMGNRMITLRRNRLPTWGGPLDLGGALVTITASNVIARLHRVNFGGTVEKPRIVFDGVEILG